MPRYIDANKLIELATHEGAYGYVDVHDICNIPPADVVAVVRCRECKWYDGCGTCMEIGIAMLEPNWFCADGKRKEKTDE